MDLPSRGVFRYDLTPGGVRMSGLPGVFIASAVAPEVHGPVRNWLSELDLPLDWDALEILARPRGLSPRYFRCVVSDESLMRGFPVPWRNRLGEWKVRLGGQPLTLAHLGYAIGVMELLWFGRPGEAEPVEGLFLMGQARLYESPLADAAWRGIQQGIFGAVCAVVVRPIEIELGGGELVEVALGELDQVGCVNARILEAWE